MFVNQCLRGVHGIAGPSEVRNHSRNYQRGKTFLSPGLLQHHGIAQIRDLVVTQATHMFGLDRSP